MAVAIPPSCTKNGGCDQPVGAAAINSVPRQMICQNLEDVCRLTDYHGGLSVLISVPDGELLAQKTFNPRLGIVGGISILGTTGIVEPMSEQALVDTIRVELRQRRAMGMEYVLLTPGNYGAEYIKNGLGVELETAEVGAVMFSKIYGSLGQTKNALASHQTRERKLEIMKDPNTGAFAVIYCGVYLMMSVGLFYELYHARTVLVFCPVFVLSRSLAVLCAVTMPNARKAGMLNRHRRSVASG